MFHTTTYPVIFVKGNNVLNQYSLPAQNISKLLTYISMILRDKVSITLIVFLLNLRVQKSGRYIFDSKMGQVCILTVHLNEKHAPYFYFSESTVQWKIYDRYSQLYDQLPENIPTEMMLYIQVRLISLHQFFFIQTSMFQTWKAVL